MDESAPLISTKIRVPALRTHTISRQRLLDLLEMQSNKGMVLVSAPAGYGKTTLLVNWALSIQQNGSKVAWLSLDPSDDDPGRFGMYLIGCLIESIGFSPELSHVAQRLRGSPEPDLIRMMQAVVNVISALDQNVVLILDDYHLITSPAIHSAIQLVLDHLPVNLRLVIGSRSVPPLALARLRVRGQLFELRMSNLRFNRGETETFLSDVMSLNLPPEHITILEKNTEGWAAGLQLAALSLAEGRDSNYLIETFSGSDRYLGDYLMEEVISHQSKDVQRLLVVSSILDRFCAPLCQAMFGDSSNIEPLIQQLNQQNLFLIPLDTRGFWYRYHRLFQDFLKNRLLKTQPDQLSNLHKLASTWLAANHLYQEAAQHAFQTLDWEYAATFVEEHSFTMIIRSEIATLFDWCSTFPEEVMAAHPLLCLHQCWAWVFSFQKKNRPKVEARLQQVERIISGMKDQKQAEILSDMIVVLRSFLVMTPDRTIDLQKQLKNAKDNLAAYTGDDAARFSSLIAVGYFYLAVCDPKSAAPIFEEARRLALRENLFFGFVESTFHLVSLTHARGNLRDAVLICRESLSKLNSVLEHPERDLPAIGSLEIALGRIILEQNDLDQAEKYLLSGINTLGGGTNPYYLLNGYSAMFRLYELKGRWNEAEQYLIRMEDYWPDISFFPQGLRLHLALRLNPKDRSVIDDSISWCRMISATIQENQTPPGLGPVGAAEVFYQTYLIWCRIQIANNNSSDIWPYLTAQIDLASKADLVSRQIDLYIIKALAYQSEQNLSDAKESLEHAMAIAQPEGFVRSFDQGNQLKDLLRTVARHGSHMKYIHKLLSAMESSTISAEMNIIVDTQIERQRQMGMIENLSQRELDVLRLMADGATNKVIAERLFITIGTVKSHINHILAKLGAQNRTEAVTRGRIAGLI